MSSVTDNCAEGEARKLAAFRLLEAHHARIICRARRALLARLLATGSATMDDVRAVVTIPVSINPKLFGAVPGPLARARIIRADGMPKTGRTIAHARHLTNWVLIDRAAAERWIALNPDSSDPPTVTPPVDAGDYVI